MEAFRTEKDSIGSRLVPTGAYFGVQSLRASENFNITGRGLHRQFIFAIVELKKAAAITNKAAGVYDEIGRAHV